MDYIKVSKCCEVKLSRYLHVCGNGQRKCSSYSFLTSTQDGVSGQGQVPAALFPRRKDPGNQPIRHEAGWAPEPVWAQRLEVKSFAAAGGRTLVCSLTLLTEIPQQEVVWKINVISISVYKSYVRFKSIESKLFVGLIKETL
jgi:hypothetical protein